MRLTRRGIARGPPRHLHENAAQARRFQVNGAGEETRTPDPRITNALLYQLSYSGEGAQYKG
jgi:hypothetical protein